MPMHGTFSSNPKTEWLTDLGAEDRNMQLLENFSYTDPAGKVTEVEVPYGSLAW